MVSWQRIQRLRALVRYHHPSQFAWRLYRVFQRQVRARLPETLSFKSALADVNWRPAADESYLSIAQHRTGLWPGRNSDVTEIAEGRFRFLGQTQKLGRLDDSGKLHLDWNPRVPRLWNFHLQCHEYILDLAAETTPELAAEVLRSWLDQPQHQHPIRDPNAWHPFCISRRIPVWLAIDSKYQVATKLGSQFWNSVADQVHWLQNNLEWDLGGNHLLENLTTLYLASCFLNEAISLDQRWIERQLLSQLEQQVLPSGEHVERTPTYHLLMLVCVIQCAEAAQFVDSDVYHQLVAYIDSMAGHAEYIATPDGRVPLLGDSVVDETPDLTKLAHWVHQHTDLSNRPSQTDYWKLETKRGDQILFDSGPLACDHLPAHGHADLLQVTASIANHDAIVDSGNFQYEPGEMRQLCRRTRAHNVLQVGDFEHADIWSSFRMGRRGHPISKCEGVVSDWRWAAAAHDGFVFPSGRILIGGDDQWTIVDWFDTGNRHQRLAASTRFHWHPNWMLKAADQDDQVDAVESSSSGLTCCIVAESSAGSELKIEEGFYCPNFGQKIPNRVLVHKIEAASSAWLMTTINLNPEVSPARFVVQLERKTLQIAISEDARIEIDRSTGHVVTDRH